MYSLTSRSSPPNETAAVPSEPPSRRYSAARYSPAGHPSVRPMQLRHVVRRPASRRPRAAARPPPARLSDRSAGPISRIRPSARSRAIRSGGSVRPASTSRDPVRHVIGQHRQRGPALPVVQQVHVIQHQHHRRGHRRERRPQPRHHRAGHRTHRRGQRLEHPPADRLHRIQRRCDVAEQTFGSLSRSSTDTQANAGRCARPTATAASSSRNPAARPPRRSDGSHPAPAGRAATTGGRSRTAPAAGGASTRKVEPRPSDALGRDEPITRVTVLHT